MSLLRLRFTNAGTKRRTVHLRAGSFIAVADSAYFVLREKIHLCVMPQQTLVADASGTWHSAPTDDSKSAHQGINADITMTHGSASDSEILASEVLNFCEQSRAVFQDRFAPVDGELLVIKYLPAIRLQNVLIDRTVFASATPGFTWGDGVYVSPLSSPFSTMMYGTVGVVGKVNVGNVFDGTNPAGRALYQRWIQTQFRYYDLLTTTIHSDYANRILRNRFKTTFGIDCVFFRPDQFAAGYVDRYNDYWLALSHWVPGGFGLRIGSGPSSVIRDIEFLLVVSEEFQQRSAFRYNPLLGAELRSRGTQPITVQPRDLNLEPALRTAYAAAVANRYSGRSIGPVYITQEIP